MIPNPCIEVQTSPATRPSVPEWFAEVTIIVHHFEECSTTRRGIGKPF